MKKLSILSTIILSLFLFSCTGNAQNKTDEKQVTKNVIEVIDFHSTNRCMTCKAIETNTKYTLDTYFAKELKSGKIVFKIVNVDKAENEKFAEKFEATGTALFLNVIKDGKEKHVDLTNFAFMKGTDQKTFSDELKQTIVVQLKNI
ncbi:MAG: nitrophenyl compound nitroreductase subunit ArsF family protein [Lutibacter sp.]|nr:nitrophenyl compound nitroreductase subunit ArsF family protein [Lutibacter sp.]MDT8417857.1 nitrophenyl compound nitroreductase subunit ArsF family protein [Lutibacter sp.]